jgi:glycosyltransferase involved in cell wall biosynthesis
MIPRLGSDPLVSVVFPVYNGEKFIKSALEEILLQTYQNIEIIFSDNSSSDSSSNILKRIKEENDNIQVYYQHQNLGAMSNVNFLFGKAKGDYILLAALDDNRSHNFIAEMVKLIQGKPYVALCLPKIHMMLTPDNKMVYTINDLSQHQFRNPLGRYYQTLFSFPNVSWYGIYRTSMIRRLPSIPETFAGDLIFIQMLSLIGRFEYCESAVLEFMMKEEWNTKSMDARFFFGSRNVPTILPVFLIVFLNQIRSIAKIRIPLHQKMTAFSILILFETYRAGLKLCKFITRNLPINNDLKLKMQYKLYFRVFKPAWITINDHRLFESREILYVLGLKK